MGTVGSTTPVEGTDEPMEQPQIDVDAELDRPRASEPQQDAFDADEHADHGHSAAGVTSKVMFVRTIGEVAGMVAAWALSMKLMNGVFRKSSMRLKDAVGEKLLEPNVDKIDSFVSRMAPGLVGKELQAARDTGSAKKIAREYAPYIVDLPVAVAASFGGKVWAQEELNKRLDVPLETHENVFSAVIDNGVQLGSIAYLVSPVGLKHKEQLTQMVEKIVKPFVKPEDLANYADYGANVQVPNLIAFGASSAYLLKQALEDPNKSKE